MSFKRRLGFVLFDLNTWEGQARSTLEVAQRLSHQCPVDLYCFNVSDQSFNEPSGGKWGPGVRYFHISPNILKPFLARASVFYLETLALTGILPHLKREPRPLIHATGACTVLSDVIQLQFVHAAWSDQLKQHPELANPKHGLKGLVMGGYREFVTEYNQFFEKVAFKRDKTYIAIANIVAKELDQHFHINGSNVHVIHHGVDPELFRPLPADQISERQKLRKSLGIKDDELVAVFVGALARKGLATAIQAVARLDRHTRAKFKLLAVGNGDKEFFKNLASGQDVAEQVVFAPFTKNIVPYYQCADLFLLPTLYEPFGLVILEAMSCGLPSIVSAGAGASELIEHGKSGLVIKDPADPGEVAIHLGELLKNPDRREIIGKNARKVAENHSWEKVASRYSEVLLPLLT